MLFKDLCSIKNILSLQEHVSKGQSTRNMIKHAIGISISFFHFL